MSKRGRPGKSAPLSVSQNFLTSRRTIRRLIRIAGLKRSDHVVEIGAGRGHITRELAQTCGRVSAYEIDPALGGRLAAEFQNSNVDVHCRDFLTAALPKDAPYKVFANIPFCRTSGIIRKLTAAAAPPEEAWLVVEKGAAKRFTGQPRESRVSLLLKPFFELEIRYHFRRDDFHPAPSVDAVLLHLRRKTAPDAAASQRQV
ncbi:MAG: rRNA adenine N(6)-methyltransferase family protein [Oscillospiraceae bacterium]|nr:rRNA adenine N(6)-methyltransferase family protein [Oscillospiraceae bacterium]